MKIEELKYKIGHLYIDMDGVITACDKAIADYNHITEEENEASGWDNKYWQNILDNANIEKFFEQMEWESNGHALLNWFRKNHISFTFLTRPVREPNSAACIRGKKIWLKKNGLEKNPVIFEFNKEKYAVSNGKRNILLDDQQRNIDKWNDAGGIGLVYKNNQFSNIIEKLSKLYGIEDEN